MRGLEPVGGFLDQVLRKFGIPDRVDLTRLVEEWPGLAGEPWAGRSRPAGLDGGELLVEVDDGATATLLSYQRNALVDRLEGALGTRLVTSVRIRVARRKKGL